MVRVVQPVKVITKDGEATVHITLELNINLNTGGLNITQHSNEPKPEEEETPKWVIPDFKANKKKIEFGKPVED